MTNALAIERLTRSRRDLALAKLDLDDGLTHEAIFVINKVVRDLTALHNALLEAKTQHDTRQQPLHCFENGPDDASTCTLPVGHDGPHAFSPDSDVKLTFGLNL